MRRAIALAVAAFVLVLATVSVADIPPWISYQGVLRDASGNPVPDGTYAVKFYIYDAETGGTELWTELQTVSAEGGIVEVLLGSVTPLNTIEFDVPYWLGIAIEGESELVPRTPFATAPYAGHAGYADTCLEGDDDWQISGGDVYHDVGDVGVGMAPSDARLDVFATDQIAGDFENNSDTSPAVRSSNALGTAAAFFGRSSAGSPPAEPAAVYGHGSCGSTGGHFSASSGYGAYIESGGYDNPALHVETGGDALVAEFVGTGGVQVDGSVYVGGFVMGNGSADGYVLTSNGGGVGTWQSPTAVSDGDWAISGDDMYSVPSEYVGIGTTGPAAKLDVRATTGDEGLYVGHSGSPGRVVTIDRTSVASSGNDVLQVGVPFGSSDSCQLIEAERGGVPVFQVFGNGHVYGDAGAYFNEDVEVGQGRLIADVYGNNVGQFTTLYTAGGAHVLHAEAPDVSTTDDGIAVYGSYEQSIDYGIGGKFEGGYMGVWGACDNAGGSLEHIGVRGYASNGGTYNYGVYGSAAGVSAYAGYFSGNVNVTGTLTASSKSFRIDHPLDPTNKYLVHACVESDEMTNVYSGNVTLDASGKAVVELPNWFEAINTDFRYQLTAIGAPGPDLYISEKIHGSRFAIAGGDPGTEVSWQVTGVRNDPYAVANRMVVEQEKPAHEVGTYTHPELYGMPEREGLSPREAAIVAAEGGVIESEENQAFDPNDGE